MHNYQRHVLRVFHYYDFFHHPLSLAEVHRFVSQVQSKGETEEILTQLCHQGVLSHSSNFYCLSGKEVQIERRLASKARNQGLLNKAHKVARVLGRVPFIRAFGISGSLSKDGASKDADIDFFIITATGKVWLVKGILKVYKKLFLRNRHQYLCTNYLVSESALELEEKNLFQATELATLLPLYGNDVLEKFFEANKWVLDFFPNWKHESIQNNEKPNAAKNLLETLLSGKVGSALNQWCLKRFQKHADQKFSANPGSSKLIFENEVSKYFPENAELPILKHMKKVEEAWLAQPVETV